MRLLGFCSLTLLAAMCMPAGACELAENPRAIVLKRPVDGPILSGFGMRTHPILMIKKMHTGTDWGADVGTAVHASAGGEVITAGREGEYGNMVVIRHGADTETAYGHLNRIDVKQGDCVAQGAVIGGVGATGLASTTQLHFEVRQNGRFIDPLVAIAEAQERAPQ
jgi:murein DD-endopeptidase MepM/ murein hydrolase activator NlpD